VAESKIHRYAGKHAVVTWDQGVCAHAGECGRGLPQAFNSRARPWIDPDAATFDALAATIARCPSGALKLYRPDGTLAVASGPGNEVAVPNVVTPRPDGPNIVAGDVVMVVAGVERRDQRFVLCRCGASANKPYCDGTHRKIGFKDPGLLPADAPPGTLPPGTVTITPTPNGPLECMGPLTVTGADGRSSAAQETWLCRCGHSQHKPFCDGSHAKAGFTG
jgi:CDGSH-type Zn-finger protein/uncharacterized Fe-S cluster protein YjdI